jgi:hypothetical protein
MLLWPPVLVRKIFPRLGPRYRPVEAFAMREMFLILFSAFFACWTYAESTSKFLTFFIGRMPRARLAVLRQDDDGVGDCDH